MPEMPDFDEIMKMAQNAQAELQKAQDNLDKIEVEGAAGGGLVKIRATAKGRILAVDIDESLLAPSEKTMVEDLIAAAINDARAKADAAAAEEMQKMQSSAAASARDSSCPSKPLAAPLFLRHDARSSRGGADGSWARCRTFRCGSCG